MIDKQTLDMIRNDLINIKYHIGIGDYIGAQRGLIVWTEGAEARLESLETTVFERLVVAEPPGKPEPNRGTCGECRWSEPAKEKPNKERVNCMWEDSHKLPISIAYTQSYMFTYEGDGCVCFEPKA